MSCDNQVKKLFNCALSNKEAKEEYDYFRTVSQIYNFFHLECSCANREN